MRCLPALAGFVVFFACLSNAAGAPRFEDFSVSASYIGPHRRPVLDTPRKRAFSTRIRAAAASPPNFAGEFVLETWGCGTGCTDFVIVRPRTGKVFMPSFGTHGGETMYGPEDSKWERIEWRIGSRLVVVNGKVGASDAEPDAHHYYTFDGEDLHYLAREKGKPFVEPPVAATPVAGAPMVAKTESASALPSTFIGRWASRHADCKADMGDGITRIEPKRLMGIEHGCDFIKIEHTGDNWTVIADCEGEGEKWASRFEMSVQGDAMILKSDKEGQSALLRCP